MTPERKFVSRGGLKLEHALDAFGIDVEGLDAADLGCNVGGFTDCLLQRGARRVFAVDTGYGALAWTLRNDERVEVMERTNALHAEPAGAVDLVVIDLGWTPQRLALPAAARWLRRGGSIVTLVKPHYELTDEERRQHLRGGVLAEELAEAVIERVLATVEERGFQVLARTASPVRGGKSGKNIEALAWVAVREEVRI